eukprot:2983483-Ditylum_brightwellii.AAC.1
MECGVDKDDAGKVKDGFNATFCNAILVSSTNTRETDYLTLSIKISSKFSRGEDVVVGMKGFEFVTNRNSIMFNNAFPD